jgi:hypothetical protein
MMFKFYCINSYLKFSFPFFFLVILEFELRASYLLGRQSKTTTVSPPLALLFHILTITMPFLLFHYFNCLFHDSKSVLLVTNGYKV